MKKILSIIIPAYNSEPYLDKCVQSLIDQRVLEKLDIIIVNDGSKDATPQIALKYCELYPGSVRLINQENKGHGGALNTGCSAAVGKYLKVIDADDWVETGNLYEFTKELEKCESDVVLTHYYTFNVSNEKVEKWQTCPKAFGKSYSFNEVMKEISKFERALVFHGITYKTEFYHEYGIQLSEHVFYEDHEFATIPCCYAKKITPLDLFVYDYRIGDVQQSVSIENQVKRISHTETVLKRLAEEYQKLQVEEDTAGKEYFCMKVSDLFLSYMAISLLGKKEKKEGRKLAQNMMLLFQKQMPKVAGMTKKKYYIFLCMNRLHISKKTWDEIAHSKIYNMLMHNDKLD